MRPRIKSKGELVISTRSTTTTESTTFYQKMRRLRGYIAKLSANMGIEKVDDDK